MSKRVSTEDLSAYLDGELSAIEMQRVRAEIEQDREAARLLDELRAVDASVRRTPVEPPAAYFDDLPGRIRARLPVTAQRARWRPPVWGLAAAAAVFVAVLAPLALRDPKSAIVDEAPVAKRVPGEAAPAVLATSAPFSTEAPGAREADAITRAKAGAGGLRDEQPAKNRARSQPVAENKLQARAAPSAADERLLREDAAPAADGRVAAAEQATVAAQEGYAPPPRQAQPQEFGPRVSQQTSAPARGPMKKEAIEPAAPPPSERRAPGGFEDAVADTAQDKDKNVAGLRAAGAPAAAQSLDFLTRRPSTATEARSLRDEARRFAEANAGDSRADQARVRVIQLGMDAWRREARAEDRETAQADAIAYLAREDARQKDRVRELLRTLNR